jgi:hypothetical protein
MHALPAHFAAAVRGDDMSTTPRKSTARKTTTRKTSSGAKNPRDAKAQAIQKARALAPDLNARIGSTPATKFRGNPDIFGRLVEDHDRHRAILAMIGDSAPGDPARKKLFREFVLEVKSHAAAEEQALWSTLMRKPKTTEVARHAVGEHKELDKIMADLAARDITSPGWKRRFAKLQEEYLHHIKEEEQEQFRDAERVLDAADLRYIRTVFNARKTAERSKATVEKKIKLK